MKWHSNNLFIMRKTIIFKLCVEFDEKYILIIYWKLDSNLIYIKDCKLYKKKKHIKLSLPNRMAYSNIIGKEVYKKKLKVGTLEVFHSGKFTFE